MGLMIAEGILLALLGALIGVVLGHLLTEALGMLLRARQQVEITGWYWLDAELWLIALGIGVGLAAALIPALVAYRTDVGRTLAEN